MKYIVNPFDATTSDCTCNCSSACHCQCTVALNDTNICGDRDCRFYCERNCESNCSNNCTGTNSVASPTSFNF